MTPGELYEKVVALGLCERATYKGHALEFVDLYGRPKKGWKYPQEVYDIAAMTVLRALESHFESTGRWFPFHIRFNLESLCLCLLRARGVDATPSPTPPAPPRLSS